MSLPTSMSAPRRCSTSRFRACTSVSPGSTRPPGNSHMSGRTAVARRCVMRYFPSCSSTAATTRIVRMGALIASHCHAEELLAHEKDVARAHLGLLVQAEEGPVGAAQVRQHGLAALPRQAAVEAGNVA